MPIFIRLLALLLTTAPALADGYGFRTPSSNIYCNGAVIDGYIDCSIVDIAGPSSIPRPPNCAGIWGHTVSLNRTGPAQMTCANKRPTRVSYTDVAAYGQTASFGPITCSSQTTGLTCINETGHGFTLSRNKQVLIGEPAPAPRPAAARWSWENGQGFQSAAIELGAIVLSVDCVTTAFNASSSVSLSVNGVPANGMIGFDFRNGQRIELPFAGGSFGPGGQNDAHFARFIQLMTTAATVALYSQNGGLGTLPLTGAATAIGHCPPRSANAGPPVRAQGNLVMQIETYLSRLGFDPGAIDGEISQLTHQAIAAYQQSRGLPVTGGMDTRGFQALEREALSR